MSNELTQSIIFARSLKTYGEVGYTPQTGDALVTINCVVKLNTLEFQNRCNIASPNYDSSINFDEVAKELFKCGEIWASRDKLLYPAMDVLSKLHGYNLIKCRRSILCNRQGQEGQTSRNYVKGVLSCDCPFGVTVKPLSVKRYKPKLTSMKWS
jgi:hypothetical protein